MGLIEEHCSQCAAAAEAKDGGGLAGAWWRSWANVSNNQHFHFTNLLCLKFAPKSRRQTSQVSSALGSWVLSLSSLQDGISSNG